MTTEVKTCRPTDTLAAAARLLWDHDCGCLPVVDERGHVHGMITDRDICMAAYTTGCTLEQLHVDGAMSRRVATVRADESLHEAEMVMRSKGVRRLPVVDEQLRLIGLLTCNDLARQVDGSHNNGMASHDAGHLVRTLATIGAPRNGEPTPTAAHTAAERVGNGHTSPLASLRAPIRALQPAPTQGPVRLPRQPR